MITKTFIINLLTLTCLLRFTPDVIQRVGAAGVTLSQGQPLHDQEGRSRELCPVPVEGDEPHRHRCIERVRRITSKSNSQLHEKRLNSKPFICLVFSGKVIVQSEAAGTALDRPDRKFV